MRTTANKLKAKEIIARELAFTKTHHALIESNVNKEDAVKFLIISQLEKAHNEPVAAIDELESLVQDWDNTEEEFHKSITIEIVPTKRCSYESCFAIICKLTIMIKQD